MQAEVQQFSALLQSLNLTAGLFKPTPAPPLFSALGNGSSFDPFGVLGNTSVASSDPLNLNAQDNCIPEPYSAPPITDQEFPPFDSAKATIFRYRQQQSVNLGSWFVHEDWMSPSLFLCASGSKVSELDIAYGWGSVEGARSVLERHWDTWITQSDMEYLAGIGINTVRLPIGYWNLGPEHCKGTNYDQVSSVYQNSWPRVKRAINMAGKSGLGVLVDLHGAVGSQNGQGHSGVSDGVTGLFQSQNNMDSTANVLNFLMKELASVTNVVGIQMLNEPKDVPELIPFYERVIEEMRQASPYGSSFPLYLHDGFNLWKFSDFVHGRDDFVVQDYHSYYVFTPSDASTPASKHSENVENGIFQSLITASGNQRRNLVIDEWSCALTAQSLSSEKDPDEARRRFCTGQMGVYATAAAGWSFWAYKKEDCDQDPGWCFKHAVGRALPNTFFPYGQTSKAALSTSDIATLFPDSRLPVMSGLVAKIESVTGPLWPKSHKRELPVYLTGFRPFDVFYHLISLARKRNEPLVNFSATDTVAAKGHSDGLMTAKIFALMDSSKLGFVDQYVNDSIAALGPNVVDGNSRQAYRDAFLQGLAEGEANVRAALST